MRPDSESALIDILKAGEEIQQFAAEITQDYLEHSTLYASAIERKFAIIGEAMVRLRNKDPEVFGQIGDGKAIIAFRNVLVHAYEVVDPALLWGNTQGPLLRLLSDVTRLLEDKGDS